MKTLDLILGYVLRTLSVLCLVALMAVLSLNIFGRYTGTLSMPWFDEVVSGLFAWMVFIGAAALWREREHFAIDLVPLMVEDTALGKPLKVFITLLGLIFALLLTWYGADYALRTTATTPILSLPQAWIYASVPIGGAAMIVYALRDFILSFRTQTKEADGGAATHPSRNHQEIDHHAV